MMERDVILFDGVCNLCNSWVQFVVKRDNNKRFAFASLQSELGQKVLSQVGMPTDQFISVLLVRNGKVYSKSRAALEIFRYLDGGWSYLYSFRIIPSFIRDFIYDIIAKKRYSWFGKSDICELPLSKDDIPVFKSDMETSNLKPA
ncbi:thiol-disulfide oxidoreductase DCC family protein [Marinigracilibium pacificum]|uniref:Thiol-disulfide oxidoreductase DCC family protein n=1 Tax=Marinigracilibium pacificum TaxID=2729599 RepID=A0A848JAZ0_9BACT|nr:thiol-disulfide oxidoreductase DCC family protein [Marinigracilibium pacificum]NMM50202.1 thiol-disulfide oxidoreductase DCC family protein [Marinigracilibium pacificum]